MKYTIMSEKMALPEYISNERLTELLQNDVCQRSKYH